MADDKVKKVKDEVVESTSLDEATKTPSTDAEIDITKPQADDKKSDKLKWYVVNTYASHENKVAKLIEQRAEASGLEEKIPEVLVPTRNVVAVKDGKQTTKEEHIFPGYVLVRMDMDENTWYLVRNTEGVTGFVGTDGKPQPISKDEVEGIKQFTSIEQPEYKASFNVGDAVKVKSGVFEEQMGTINTINEQKGKVTVLLTVFGRETPVDLDFTDVVKI